MGDYSKGAEDLLLKSDQALGSSNRMGKALKSGVGIRSDRVGSGHAGQAVNMSELDSLDMEIQKVKADRLRRGRVQQIKDVFK